MDTLTRNLIDLNGIWTCRDAQGKLEPMDAVVPGSIHQALHQAGRIPDPYAYRNELDLQWIGETDWIFERTFHLDSSTSNSPLFLITKGLDTLAHIEVNGHKVGESHNMFREMRFDLGNYLKVGENHLRITFIAVMPYVLAKEKERHLQTPKCIEHETYGRPWVRKEQCSFGWDWGPVLVGCGIWLDIYLESGEEPKLEDLLITQEHRDGKVLLHFVAKVNEDQDSVQVYLQGDGDGKQVSSLIRIEDGSYVGSLEVDAPKLWWPNGLGEAHLYQLSVIAEKNGKPWCLNERRIGLRTVELIQEDDAWGRSFAFQVNGVKFFSKGANWIPADAKYCVGNQEVVQHMLLGAIQANMNMIRVWGGGIYETDLFYDLCDQMGLLVWQDFMFACSDYPCEDSDFMNEVALEAEDQIRRLRHHPSLALWCGNNEMEKHGIKETPLDPNHTNPEFYLKLFDVLLADKVKVLDPQRSYWPASPHSPYGDRTDDSNPECGDAHLWAVWHGRQPFEWYRSSTHRFCSEFGFQSFPEPKTVAEYAGPRDLNISSPVMEFHQRSRNGNSLIMEYMLSWFPMPSGFESTIWMSQILQALSIKYACEHWRRMAPRCMGALYWQLNDCWPVASWASIDSRGRWKALHYYAKNFFAPVVLSGVEDNASGQVDLHLVCDPGHEGQYHACWTLTDTQGSVLKEGSSWQRCEGFSSGVFQTLDLSKERQQYGDAQLLLWLELKNELGKTMGKDLVTFAKPKGLSLLPAEISVTRGGNSDAQTVTLESDRPALFVFLEDFPLGVRPSDNFFHLRPGVPVVLNWERTGFGEYPEGEVHFRVKSITDLYEC